MRPVDGDMHLEIRSNNGLGAGKRSGKRDESVSCH